MTVLIIGAGIGGLVLALELHRHRIPVRMYEAAGRLDAVGVGINILPHATRILAQLGLEAELEKLAVLPSESRSSRPSSDKSVAIAPCKVTNGTSHSTTEKPRAFSFCTIPFGSENRSGWKRQSP